MTADINSSGRSCERTGSDPVLEFVGCFLIRSLDFKHFIQRSIPEEL